MPQTLARLPETPSQTAGPFVHIGATPNRAGIRGVYAADLGARPFPDDAPGERITVTGRILDGAGAPVRDAVIESWQPDGEGRFAGGAAGFARLAVDTESGEWRLETVKPGPVPAPDGGLQAPHIALWIVARGIHVGLSTRIYFADDDNGTDAILARAAAQGRAGTLIAAPDGAGGHRFDIRLQGPDETVFLDL